MTAEEWYVARKRRIEACNLCRRPAPEVEKIASPAARHCDRSHSGGAGILRFPAPVVVHWRPAIPGGAFSMNTFGHRIGRRTRGIRAPRFELETLEGRALLSASLLRDV